MATSKYITNIVPPIAPRLPSAPPQYDSRFLDLYSNVLRLYFNGVDTTFGGLLGDTQKQGSTDLLSSRPGQIYLAAPYGHFYDTTDQIAASTTTAYIVALSNTEIANGVTLVSGTRVKFSYAGVYNVQFSIQLSNYSNDTVDIDIWFKQNGSNIAQSNSRFGLRPRKSIGDPSHTVGTVNLFITAQVNDYVELAWCTTNVDAYIQHYAVGVSPTRPAVPSVIVSATFVSRLPT